MTDGFLSILPKDWVLRNNDFGGVIDNLSGYLKTHRINLLIGFDESVLCARVSPLGPLPYGR